MEGAAVSITTTAASLVVKLCGLFSSSHDGERASAAAKADAIIREHGMTWADVIRPEPPTEAKIRFLLETDDTLTGWECDFLYGIRDLPELSEKQQAVLDRLYRRARR